MQEDKTTDNIGVSYKLYNQALIFALKMGEISSPMIQREFHVPYRRSAAIMDLLELNGITEKERSANGRYKIKA